MESEAALLAIIADCCDGCPRERAALDSLLRLKKTFIEHFVKNLIKRKPWLIQGVYDIDDVRASSMIGFMKAARTYDSTKASFNTHVGYRMTAQVIRDNMYENNIIYVIEEKEQEYRKAIKDELAIDKDVHNALYGYVDINDNSHLLLEKTLNDKNMLYKDLIEIMDELGYPIEKSDTLNNFVAVFNVKNALIKRGWNKEDILEILNE